jgi:putative transposase
MRLSFKYRIYPNQDQEAKLLDNFDFCRFLYNNALEERISYYKTFDKSRSYVDQASFLPEIKKEFPKETSFIHSQVLQATLKQLETSYKNFFRRVKNGEEAKGFPRFKKENRFRSICFPQVASALDGGAIKLLDDKHINISKIGSVKIEYHRPIQGQAKLARIVRQSGDKWFIVISCDNVPLSPLEKTGNTVAIDLGISNFITTDDGTTFHHPKPYKTSLEKLQYIAKKRAAKQRGSNNSKKMLVAEQRAHEKIVNIRSDFQHKIAKQLVAENDIIIVEDLNIKGMLEAEGFSVKKSNISDASWGNFVALLIYKAERAGKKVIEVDPRNTSKMCSCCGNIKNDLTLRDRVSMPCLRHGKG